MAVAIIALAGLAVVLSDDSDAATGTEIDSENIADYYNEEKNRYEFNPGEYYLGSDLSLSGYLIFDGDCTLDLNGHTVTTTHTYGIAEIHGTLTIGDSSADGKGMVTTSAENGVALYSQYNIVVNGGTYEADYALQMWGGVAEGCYITVNGGTFNGDVAGLRAYAGTVTINNGTFTGPQSGGIGAQVRDSGTLIVNGGSFTGQNAIQVDYGGNLTMTKGDVEGAYSGVWLYTEAGYGGSTFTMEGGEVSGQYGIVVYGGGTESDTSSLTVKDGTVTGTDTGITGNGNDGSACTVITIEGGDIKGDKGIYHPQRGELRIVSGDITADTTGIEMRAGSLTVTGGNITSNAESYSFVSNSNGNTTSGAAIAVAPYHEASEDGTVSVTITGGTMRAPVAFSQANPNEVTAPGYDFEISGGDFTSTATNPTTLTTYPAIVTSGSDAPSGFVTGGTFTSGTTTDTSVEDYLDPAYGMDTETGQIAPDATKYVAHIGDRYYASLSQAVAEATDGDTIYLDASTEITSTIYVRSDVTIDLCEKTLTFNVRGYGDGIYFMSDTTEIRNGNVVQVNPSDANLACGLIAYTGTLTIDGIVMTISETTATSSFGAMTYAGATLNISDSSITYVGTGSPNVLGVRVQASTDDPSTAPTTTLNMTNVAIDVPGAGVLGNGTECNTVIDIASSTITSDSLGIYHPQSGKMTIRDTSVTGPTGIEMRDGTVEVYGDSVITGTAEFDATANGNGSTVLGVGLAVSQYDSGREIAVGIHGGTFNGAYGLYECALMDTSDATKVDIVIEDGTFNGTTAAVLINNFEDMDGTKITGGTFSSDVSDYMAAGLETTTDADGNTVVVTPDLLTTDELYVLGDTFRLPLGIEDESLVDITWPEGFTVDENGLVTVGSDVVSDTYRITVTLTSTGHSEILLLSYVPAMFETESDVKLIITDSAETRGFVESKLEGMDDVPQDATVLTFDVERADGLKDGVPFTIDLSLFIQDMEIMVLHFVGDSVDYPEYTLSDGVVTVNPESFSPFAILFYTPVEEPDEEPDLPVINPGWNDDDYVPLPPQIVYEESPEDDTTEIVACAAAAVVAALMAAFLIIERRRN